MTALGQTNNRSSQLVLVVENHKDTREMYAEWLTFAGFRVAEATTGAEPIEKAWTLKPDIITMDIGLSGAMDGCEPTEHLKSYVYTNKIPSSP